MNKVDGVPVARHPLVAKWVLGDRSYNLDDLHHASPKDMMLKALFLLAATSTPMISEPLNLVE